MELPLCLFWWEIMTYHTYRPNIIFLKWKNFTCSSIFICYHVPKRWITWDDLSYCHSLPLVCSFLSLSLSLSVSWCVLQIRVYLKLICVTLKQWVRFCLLISGAQWFHLLIITCLSSTSDKLNDSLYAYEIRTPQKRVDSLTWSREY